VLAFVATATRLRRALILIKISSVKIFIYLDYKVLRDVTFAPTQT